MEYEAGVLRERGGMTTPGPRAPAPNALAWWIPALACFAAALVLDGSSLALGSGGLPGVLAGAGGIGGTVRLVPALCVLCGMLFSTFGLLGSALAQDEASAPAEDTAAPPETSEETSAEPLVVEAPSAEEGAGEVQTIPVTVPEPDEQGTARDSTMLDTIEVTSSKRIKAQRDLPGSVGAIRGEELEKIRAQGLSDYLKQMPGVSLADYESGRQIIVIRGIASSIGAIGTGFTSLTTGIYVDEMPFNDLFAPLSVPDLNPFDLERVEVLKGPQGTLFGSGALAGAVRYVLQKPKHSIWETKASATVMQTKFADDLSTVGAFAQNVPLFGDTAALRFVGVYREDPGILDSLPNDENTRDEKDINGLKQFTGRVLGSWNVTDRMKVSGFGFLQDTDIADLSSSENPDRPERNDIPFASPRENGFGGGNLVADYGFDAARLLYTGTYLEKDTFIRAHQERGPLNDFSNQQDIAWYNQIIGSVNGQTHELRLSSPDGGTGDWEWLVGAAYMNYIQGFFQFSPNPGPADGGYYANPPEGPGDVPPGDRASSFLFATVDGDGTEIAVFGEATRRLGEHWEVTLGGRQFQTELLAQTVLAGGQISALFPGETERRDNHVSEAKGFNPKFSLRYLHDNHIQAHVLAAKGFQFGGFQLNPPAPGFEASAEEAGFNFGPYESSELWNYEMALRTEWLDRRLRLDLTAFYMEWTDLQLTVAIPVNPESIPAPPGSGIPEDATFGAIVNVGAAHSEGLEASLEVIPFPGATFTSSAAWMSAVTDEAFDNANSDGAVPAGTRLPGSPRFQWANVLGYRFALPYFSSWNSTIALTHVHIGTSPNSIRPNAEIGGYDTLDARLSLARPNSRYLPELGVGVNNITDVRGFAGAFVTNANQDYFFVRPRTTLATLSWRY